MDIQSAVAGPWTRMGIEPSGSAPARSGGRCCEHRCADPAVGAGPAEPSGAAAALSYRRSERFSLIIQTQEGDLVRLSFKTREAVDLAAGQVEAGGQSAGSVTLTARSNSRLSMTVEGNLSADELAAIQDTFDQAAALAEEFFAGNVQGAFDGASALQIDAEQLARVSMKAGLKEKVTYAAISFGSQPAASLPPAQAAPAAPPSDPEPAPVSSAPPPAAAPAPAPEVEEPADPVATPAATTGPAEGGATAAGEESGEGTEPRPSSEPLRIIGGFLGRLAESFGGGFGDAEGGVLGFSLKVRIFESTLVTLSEVRAPEQDALPALVPETLEAVAEQSRPPLDRVA
ncbi:MAG: hypothetical protein R3E98_19850 [Gemmatimonadota bacterium]|nr:hypothetical protein [Gemmatimonadota bacterium]